MMANFVKTIMKETTEKFYHNIDFNELQSTGAAAGGGWGAAPQKSKIRGGAPPHKVNKGKQNTSITILRVYKDFQRIFKQETAKWQQFQSLFYKIFSQRLKETTPSSSPTL